jgi:hypothetical protein
VLGKRVPVIRINTHKKQKLKPALEPSIDTLPKITSILFQRLSLSEGGVKSNGEIEQ